LNDILTRLGDGTFISLTKDEVRREIEEGVENAADRAEIDPLTKEDIDRLYDIIVDPRKFVSVEPGNELILSYDGFPMKLTRVGIPIERPQILKVFERAFGSDTLEMAYVHYSIKPLKINLSEEVAFFAESLQGTIAPLMYGAMPNMSLYTKPDGPCENAAELLPLGKIKEAQEAQMEAAQYLEKDIMLVAGQMYEAGADGFDFDTTAAAGDAEFYAVLKAIERLKAKYPEMGIEVGMSGEFILGFHGSVEYAGTRLAGLYPHEQIKMVEKAGGTIFGAVINTNSSRSFPWNLARAITMCKACGEVANIPVHANVGMGVGGIPLTPVTPIDCVSRTSTAMAEIAKMDGL